MRNKLLMMMVLMVSAILLLQAVEQAISQLLDHQMTIHLE